MKSIFAITALLAATLLLTSATIFQDAPQDPPQKGKKHISIVKIDDQGNKMHIDTVIGVKQIFVFNGDTIGGGKEFRWNSEDGSFNFNGDMEFDIDVETDEEGNVFVMKNGNITGPKLFKIKTDDDSTKQYRIKMITNGDCENMDIMNWNEKAGKNLMFDPTAPKVMMLGDRKKGNVIDLSDPGIISYSKKDMKGGKEKIVIIREKPSPEENEAHEEIIINSTGTAPMMWHRASPVKTKQIKVIAGDDGKVEILEDGGVWSVDQMEDDVKVIEKDGKKITIKKIKEGDEMKVNVEVEEKKEEN